MAARYLVLGVLDGTLLEDLVRLRLEVIHERLQRTLQVVLVTDGEVRERIVGLLQKHLKTTDRVGASDTQRTRRQIKRS